MTMTPQELEYLAECEPMQVVPNFNMKKMCLISGDVGPFRPGIPAQVPLWMAINLSKSSKAKIITPDWMNVEKLNEVKKKEKESALFAKMPSEHYMAIAKLLFQSCPGEIADCDEVKTLIKDIWDIRYAKLRKSMKLFLTDKVDQSYAQVDNLTMMEMCQIRPFFTHSLEQIHRVRREASLAVAATQDSQNLFANNSMAASGGSQSQSQS